MNRTAPQLPFIVRLAGLSADCLAPFESSLCAEPLKQIARLNDEIEGLRGSLVEDLFQAIGDADSDARKQMVALKRDVFNGRSLERWLERPAWSELEPVAGSACRRILGLEDKHDRQLNLLRSSYDEQKSREEEALTELANDPEFVRGLGLSSLVLARNLSRLSSGKKLRTKRRRRMMTGLLRYATRAALKLSPFSTLTPVGMGCPGAGTPTIPATLQPQSGIWLHRYFLDQLVDLLSTHRAFRAGLDLRLNDTLEALPDGRLRFLRPRRWQPKSEENQLSRRQPALVRVGLNSPITDSLRRRDLDGPRTTYRQVLDELDAEFADRSRDDLATFVDRLIDIGFLLAAPPWPSTEIDVQRHLLAYLEETVQTQASGAELAKITKLLRSLLGVLAALPSSEKPAGLIAEAKKLAENLGRATLQTVGAEPTVRFFEEERDHYFSEDVFLTPEASEAGDAVLNLAPEEIEALVRDVAPLARLTAAFDHSDDYRLTLGATAKERWPGSNRVPLLEFFEATQPVYREYIRFQMEARRTDRPRKLDAFNPRGLATVEDRREARVDLSKQLKHLFPHTDEGRELDHTGLSGLLDSMPGSAGQCRDFSAFFQPCQNGTRRWVLTDLFEGAGRLSSRYTTIMPERVQQTWSESFAERSILDPHGQPIEILDLYCPDGHTLNVHAPQTRRMLELPGERLDLPRQRRLRLRDLAVDFSGPMPVLMDADGRPLAPLHLGGVVARYMPSLFKFLALFGTTELLYRMPVAAGRHLEDLRVVDRHTIGSVIYRRKTWTLDRSKVLPRFEHVHGSELMRTVDRWRRLRGMPAQVFMQEPVEGGLSNPHRKPQFIDFTSPALVELFRSILLNDFPTFALAEALPSTQQHPFAKDGRRRAYEIQIDTFGARRAANSTVGTARAAPTLSEVLPAVVAGEA